MGESTVTPANMLSIITTLVTLLSLRNIGIPCRASTFRLVCPIILGRLMVRPTTLPFGGNSINQVIEIHGFPLHLDFSLIG